MYLAVLWICEKASLKKEEEERKRKKEPVHSEFLDTLFFNQFEFEIENISYF